MTMDKTYIPLKTSLDVSRIRKSCRIIETILIELGNQIAAGITTNELDRMAESHIKKHKATPILKGYHGFPGSICTSVNQIVAHGTPSNYRLKEGDIITIDITVETDGWFGDGAWTFGVGNISDKAKQVIQAAWKSSLAGIMAIRSGSFLGNIGQSVSCMAKKCGCSVIREFVGHGIGENLHEDPAVPYFGKKGTGRLIVPGMVFTIEPVICLGKPQVIEDKNGWNWMTQDNSLSAQFENTIAVFKDRIEILTLSQGKMKDFIDYPPQLI